jgi:hypothetical protein
VLASSVECELVIVSLTNTSHGGDGKESNTDEAVAAAKAEEENDVRGMFNHMSLEYIKFSRVILS